MTGVVHKCDQAVHGVRALTVASRAKSAAAKHLAALRLYSSEDMATCLQNLLLCVKPLTLFACCSAVGCERPYGNRAHEFDPPA